jgi:2-polyprenyl-3-methyl-5-hydroxy-6-metoxy-1,4-benzoquinol methylase
MSGQSTSRTPVMPAAINDGVRIQTLNGYGWMITKSIAPAEEFVEFAATSPHWAMDIGCAYGIHTISALKAGARVVAVDLDEGHLQILREQVEPELRKNLQTVRGAFPDVQLPESTFGAILACRVLHFLDGPTMVRAAKRLYELLAPGGKVFVRTISAYTQISARFIAEYERRKAAGEEWPGFVQDPSAYIDDALDREACRNTPLHYFEPDSLAKIFENAGFVIEKASYFPIDLDWVKLDGRESLLLIARKP